MPIRAVLFDLDDTLCDDLAAAERCIRAAVERASHCLPGLSVDALTDAYLRLSDVHWNAIDLIAPPSIAEVRRFLWRSALQSCGHADCDPAVLDDVVTVYTDLRRSGVRLFPETLPTLDRLRAEGYRLGLVTNGVSETHAEKVVTLGIRDHFDTLLMPDVIGWAKPDPRVFHTACAHLGVAPHEAAMVGDSQKADVGGAKSAGLLALWFNPHDKRPSEEFAAPDAVVRSLAEVPGIVGAARSG